MDIDLDQARRRARELLRDARAGDPGALVRMRADRAPRLTDAQRAVAAELGFAFWPALVAHSRWHPVTAGVAHDPEETALLLARGADPDDGESVYHAIEAATSTCLEIEE